MSIRINTILGYGLTDIEFDRNVLERTDSRINDFETIYNYDKNVKDFLNYLEDKEKCLNILKDINPYADIYVLDLLIETLQNNLNKQISLHPVIYDPEYGEPNVLMFCPIEKSNYYRCDDDIDYYFNLSSDIGNNNVVQDLTHKGGIYPYNSSFFHIPGSQKYGEKEFPHVLGISLYNSLIHDKMTDIAKYVLKSYRPHIFPSVVLYAKYINIFKDFDKTIHELRPMIYQYWS